MRDNSNCVIAIMNKGLPSAIRPDDSTRWGSGKTVRPDSLQGIRVMVVDDAPDIAEEVAEALEFAGATSLWVSDPLRAKEILSDSAEDWSLLVTDLEMPECSGLELAAFSAALATPIPVILITGTSKPEHIKCSRLFSAVIRKPICADQLIWAVHEYNRLSETKLY